MVNIDRLKQILETQEAFVKFTKKNGDERVMRCTRNISMIPKDQLPKGIGLVRPGVTPVYDLDNKGWRSFIDESVISYEYTEMQDELDKFFNRVFDDAYDTAYPDKYMAKYLESFIRYNLYENISDVRDKIADLNKMHETYKQLDKNFI